MKLVQISDFKLGRYIQGFYLCKEKNLRHTRNGDMFIDIILSDATGIIYGKLWNLVEDFQDRFDKGDPVAVKGKITSFNDNLQLTVTQINKATDNQYNKYGFSKNILIKQINESIDDLWMDLFKIINSLDQPYRQIIVDIYKENEKKIKSISILSDNVEVVRGSFLKSLYMKSNILLNILEYYPNMDKNLVISGVLLKDIGKIKCVNDDLQFSYTDEGMLIGYKNLSIEILQKSIRKVDNFPKNILLQLEHIILYSIINNMNNNKPQFPEVLFVKHISKLDMDINSMLNPIKDIFKKY